MGKKLRLCVVSLFVTSLVVGLNSLPPQPARASQTNSWGTLTGSGQSLASTSATSCGDLGAAGAFTTSYPNPIRTVRIGTDLFVGGCFLNWAGIAEADFVARWDGTSWSGLGSNGSGNGAVAGPVYDMTSYKGNLVIAGDFDDVAGESTADAIATWNGTAWSGFTIGTNNGCPCAAPSSASDYATALEVDTKSTPTTTDDELIIGGRFPSGANDGSQPSGFSIANTSNVFKWTGTTFAALTTSNPFDDADSNLRVRKRDFLPMDFQFVGSALYMASYRTSGSFASYAAVQSLALQRLGSSWESTAFAGTASSFGVGWGVTRLAAKDGDLYVGGVFNDAGGVATADYLAILNTSASTWSNLNDAGVTFVTERGVHAIEIVGSQVMVSVPGGAFGVKRWTGSRWITLSTSNAVGLYHDQNYSGSNDRLLMTAINTNLAGVTEADYFASLELTSSSSLDAATSTNASPALSFSGGGPFNLSIPVSACSETLNLTTGDSGAGFAENPIVALAPGQTVSRTFSVVSSDGTSTTSYTFNINRDGPASLPNVGATSTSSVTSSSANLTATYDTNNDDGSYYFEYSTNSDMSSASALSSATTSCGADSGTATGSVYGLTAGTTYYARLVSTNSSGTRNGAITSFTTSAPTPTVVAATSVATTSATLNGTLNPGGTNTKYYFEYGTSLSFGSRTATPQWVGQGCFGTSGGMGNTPSAVSGASISGLTPNTTYYFRLVACWDWPSVSKQSSALSFTTLADSTTSTVPPSNDPPATTAPAPETSSAPTSSPTTPETTTTEATTTTVPSGTSTSSPLQATVAPTTAAPATTTVARALSAPSSATGKVGATMTLKVTIAPTTKSVTASGLPVGVKFNARSGTLSGKPTKRGTYTVRIAGVQSGKRFTITVRITIK